MTAGTEEKLLSWLAHCAAMAEPCPTNEAIRSRFGIGDSSVGALLSRLEAQGKIVLRRTMKPRGRIVTIVASGKQTAAPRFLTPPRRAA